MKKRYILGMDIGGTKCAVLLASVENGMELLDKVMFPTDTHLGYEQARDRLLWEGHALLNKHGLEEQLLAVGVSCGGPLDSRQGLILSPPNLPGWDNIPFAKLLEQEFGVPAFLQNDANACALVEWKLGAGRGCENMLFLTMGTGFGAGVIAEGRLLRGASDMGGEIGHIRLAPDGPIGFGKAGSIEGFCSGGGIGLQARALTGRLVAEGCAPAWARDGLSGEDITARTMAEYAKKGDADALKFYREIGARLGEAVSVLMDAFNPERIVIGSIFVRCEELLRQGMEEAVEREALVHTRQACKIVPAATGEQLGDLASIMAACYELCLEPTPLEDPAGKMGEHLTELMERYPALEGCRQAIAQAYGLLEQAYSGGGKLLVCGNGGSAADAEHIVGELMKGFYKPRTLEAGATRLLGEKGNVLQGALLAIALTGHSALSTAFSNDVDPSLVFAQQVLGYGRRGDVFLGISTSGNSANVVKAAETAAVLGLRTIALTGEGGGRLEEVCDVTISVPCHVTAHVQELHLPVYHALCSMLEERFF